MLKEKSIEWLIFDILWHSHKFRVAETAMIEDRLTGVNFHL